MRLIIQTQTLLLFNQNMTTFSDKMARLPKGWTPILGGGTDKNGCKFTIDLRGPITISKIDGENIMFKTYNDLHKYISQLFIKQK